MRTRALFYTLLLVIFFSQNCYPQENEKNISILFYNVENLFDPVDDPLTSDDEFTANGPRHWTYSKLSSKQINIAKVILSAAEWDLPSVVGLCEVENLRLLEYLVNKTPLKTSGYKIIHKESPDHRGIDVAMLYDPLRFVPLTYNYYPLVENETVLETREILYVSGIVNAADTLHLFFNHWPSRYGGLLETKPQRKLAATVLRDNVRLLYEKSPCPKIVIMGDFNDQPNDESVCLVLNATAPENRKIVPGDLYNLSYNWQNGKSGSLKYRSQWFVFDQIIVSGSLLIDKNAEGVTVADNFIIKHGFIMEDDRKYGGQKPKRSWLGYKYRDGFSDHLPVLLKLKVNRR